MELDLVQLPIRLATEEIRRICSDLEKGFLLSDSSNAVDGDPIRAPDIELERRARWLLQTRRRRSRHFQDTYFGEPIWDMLLDLFVAKMSSKKVSVSSLCIAAAVPPTTALRYISMLCEQGAIIRCPDPNDCRRIHLMLSDEVQRAMVDYLNHECRHFP